MNFMNKEIKKMNQTVQTTGSGGIGFGGLLAIVFIVLKLTGVIAWSWWWVLSPLWIPFALIIGILGLIGIALLPIWLLEELKKGNRK